MCVLPLQIPLSQPGFMRNSEPDSAEVSLTMLHAQGEQKPAMNSSVVHWDNYTPVLIEKKGKKKREKKKKKSPAAFLFSLFPLLCQTALADRLVNHGSGDG